MSRPVAATLLIVAVLAIDRSAQACAGCSNPNLASARAGNTALSPGEVSVALNLLGTTMHVVHSETCPDIGPICSQRAEPPQLHDQRFYVSEFRPIIGIGITKVFGAEIQMPVRLLRTTIIFRRLDGTPFVPDYENIHHRNETLFGLADPWLLGRATLPLDKLVFSGRAGVGLPFGRTEEDPFARGRAGLPHEHIQFGTGTFYPVIALDAEFVLDDVRLSGYVQSNLFLYENRHGYRAGNRYVSGLSGDLEVVRHFRVGLGGDIVNEQPERWGGVIQQDGNVGRTDVLAGGTLGYAFGSVTASIAVKVPVYQHFLESSHDHGGDSQLTYPAIINLGVQTSFGGSGAAPPIPAPR